MRFYRDIIAKAGSIARHHTYLWWFGLFTLFMGGKGVEFEMFFSDARLFGGSLSPFSPAFWDIDRWSAVQTQVLGGVGNGALMLAIAAALSLAVVILVVISQGALIDATAVIHRGGTYSVMQGVETGRQFFGRLFSINVIGKVLTYLSLAIIGIPVFVLLDSPSVASVVYTVIVFLVLTPVAMMVSLLVKYAQSFVVLDNNTVGQAWKAAWELFKHNWIVSIEMAALMFALYFGVGIFAIFISAVLTLPVLVFLLAATLFFSANVLFLYIYIFYLVVILAMIVGALFFATMHYASWTLLFMELKTGKRVPSKLERLYSGEKAPEATTVRSVSQATSSKPRVAKRPVRKTAKRSKRPATPAGSAA